MSKLDQDVFSCILSFIFDSHTIYKILRAIPTTDSFFSLTLHRLCQLPIHLSSDGQSNTASLEIVNLLLSEASSASILHAIRHLILSFGSGSLAPRLPDLFHKTRNLQILDWGDGVGPSANDFDALQKLERLKTLRIDASVERSNWKMDHFANSLGKHLHSLILREVDLDMYRSIEAQSKHFSSYHMLRHLSVDLTGGVWDWDGLGSPQNGASDRFVFANLGFPALTELHLTVGDLTIMGERAGPMDLVDWKPLKELSLTVLLWWVSNFHLIIL